VADPLLYVLAKSIRIKEEPPLAGEIQPTPTTPTFPPRTMTAIIVGLLVLLIILFVLWRSESDGKPQSNLNVTPGMSASPQRAANPSKSPTPPPRMAYVPGGAFTMGNTGGDVYERPPHKVLVKPFFIDLYEVTCEEYARFVKETAHAPPPDWPGGRYPPGATQQPVTAVTWDDAVAYARWAGKRLPTEEEWEFAARGSDARLYPWGNEWEAGMSNSGGVSRGGLVDVGTFKGVSPFGVYDMVGNAWEWTASDLKPYPGGQLSVAPKVALKVIRGGSWKEGPQEATATYRGYLPVRGGKDYSVTGFRCAQDVTVPPASSSK
jgi:formylglycine-generating enzyme required for sulfatase activity